MTCEIAYANMLCIHLISPFSYGRITSNELAKTIEIDYLAFAVSKGISYGYNKHKILSRLPRNYNTIKNVINFYINTTWI